MNIFNILKANTEISNLQKQLKDVTEDRDGLLKKISDNEAKVSSDINYAEDKANAEKKLEDLTKAHAEEIKTKLAEAKVDFDKKIQEVISGHEQAIKDLSEKHAQELADAKKAISEATASAGKVAATIVASKGLDPETIKISSSELVGSNGNGRFSFTKTK